LKHNLCWTISSAATTLARIALFLGLDPKWAKGCRSYTRRRAAHTFIAPPTGYVCVCVFAVCAKSYCRPPRCCRRSLSKRHFLPQPNPKDFNCANFCAGEKFAWVCYACNFLEYACRDWLFTMIKRLASANFKFTRNRVGWKNYQVVGLKKCAGAMCMQHAHNVRIIFVHFRPVSGYVHSGFGIETSKDSLAFLFKF
jgi:hypothetical protein